MVTNPSGSLESGNGEGFAISPSSDREIFSIGHSTHSRDEFTSLLRRLEVGAVSDVRAFPSSRRLPHFNRAALEAWLPQLGVDYRHYAQLGGRRKSFRSSPNTGWEVEAFQAYADHMSTSEFEEGLTRLTQLASSKRTAFMCAEGLWWNCHRRLLSDALLHRGWKVVHILPDGSTEHHRMTEFAVTSGETILYPPSQERLL